MVGGTTPPQSDSGEISRVLSSTLLWQSKRCSRTAQDISVLTTPLLLSMGLYKKMTGMPLLVQTATFCASAESANSPKLRRKFVSYKGRCLEPTETRGPTSTKRAIKLTSKWFAVRPPRIISNRGRKFKVSSRIRQVESSPQARSSQQTSHSLFLR